MGNIGIGLFSKPIFEPIPQKLLVIIILGIGLTLVSVHCKAKKVDFFYVIY
jgi:F0F1-type ATP synthase assembly protein I